MKPDEASRLAQWIQGLFPEITPNQVSFLADQFAPFDVAVVESEAKRFRRHFDSLHIANPPRRITDEQQKRTPRPASRAERRESEAQQRQEDAALAALSDDELARRKRSLLEENPKL